MEGEGEISLAELVRWALRMTPDRVIVGEVRGREVVPMLNAMCQGNDGSMTTLHACSSRGAFMKLAAYAAQSAEHLSARGHQPADRRRGALRHPARLGHRRPAVISSIREVIDADGRQVVSNEIYAPGPDRRAVPAVPVRAATMDELAAAGYQPDGSSQVTGNVALAGLLGAGAGLGLVLAFCGLRRRQPAPAGPRWRDALARARRQATMPRVAGALAAAVAVAAITRWPVGTMLAGLAAWFLPRALGPDRAGEASVRPNRGDRLVDRAAARHPGRRGRAGAGDPGHRPHRPRPDPRAGHRAWPPGSARGSGCPTRCGPSPPSPPTRSPTWSPPRCSWPPSSRPATWASCCPAWPTPPASTPRMRLRIAAGRARVRTASRIIIAVTVALTAGLLAWSRAFLAPYDSPAGQLVLLAVGGCFAAAFWWLHKIAGFGENPRILTGLGALPGAELQEARR